MDCNKRSEQKLINSSENGSRIRYLDRYTWRDIYQCLAKGMPVDDIVFELKVTREEVLFVILKLRQGGHDF